MLNKWGYWVELNCPWLHGQHGADLGLEPKTTWQDTPFSFQQTTYTSSKYTCLCINSSLHFQTLMYQIKQLLLVCKWASQITSRKKYKNWRPPSATCHYPPPPFISCIALTTSKICFMTLPIFFFALPLAPRTVPDLNWSLILSKWKNKCVHENRWKSLSLLSYVYLDKSTSL